MAGIAGDLFLKLYLVILVSGKLALWGWFGILETFLQMQGKKKSHFKYRQIRPYSLFLNTRMYDTQRYFPQK